MLERVLHSLLGVSVPMPEEEIAPQSDSSAAPEPGTALRSLCGAEDTRAFDANGDTPNGWEVPPLVGDRRKLRPHLFSESGSLLGL